MRTNLIFAALFLSLIILASAESTNTSPLSTLNTSGTDIAKKINTGAEDVLLKEITLPSWLIIPAKVLGIEEKITWQSLIITFAFWIGLFIIILSIMEIMPFLNQGVTKFFGALIITMLISVTGAVYQMSKFFFNVAGFFELANKYSTLKIIIAILIALVVVFIFSYASKILKRKTKIKTAELKGQQINNAIRNINAVNQINRIRLGNP